jgi:hypothetical protein
MAYNVLSWLSLFISTLLPFCFMTVVSVLIIREIQKVRPNNSQSTSQLSSLRRPRIVRRTRFSITILLLNCTFIMLNLPICVYFIMARYDSLFFLIGVLMAFTSTIVPFFLYCASSIMFRREFLNIFCAEN